jgi:hypothetical protein
MNKTGRHEFGIVAMMVDLFWKALILLLVMMVILMFSWY